MGCRIQRMCESSSHNSSRGSIHEAHCVPLGGLVSAKVGAHLRGPLHHRAVHPDAVRIELVISRVRLLAVEDDEKCEPVQTARHGGRGHTGSVSAIGQ
eukprot:7383317-Prymnesium_polylepis.3